MADEEEQQVPVSSVPAAFDPLDTTEEIPHPKRFVFIVPNGNVCPSDPFPFNKNGGLVDHIEMTTLMTIKHPRHGAPQMVFINPIDGSFYEVQEHHRKFGGTWLIDEYVEPNSPLYFATPLDMVFIAIYVLRGCVCGTIGGDGSVNPNAPSSSPATATASSSSSTNSTSFDVKTKFLDAYSLLGRCPHLSILPPISRAAIETAFLFVADVKDSNGTLLSRESCNALLAKRRAITSVTMNAEAEAKLSAEGAGGASSASSLDEPYYYYRFCEDKCVSWLKRKYERVLGAMTADAVASAAAGRPNGSTSLVDAATCVVSSDVTDREAEAKAENAADKATAKTTTEFDLVASPARLSSSGIAPPSSSSKVSSSSSSLSLSFGLGPAMVAEKAAQLLAEYLDRGLEPLVLRATDGKVDLAAIRQEAINIRRNNNTAAAASRAAVGTDAVGVDDISGEPAEKKKRVEMKSASVKKLEKAGAPKGTPTLFSMFAKKAAASPQAPPPPQ